jgi:two-component system, OmpR family, phosphate regulon response regulator PhoB
MSQQQTDPKHILVIDDEPDTLEMISTMLRAGGFTATGVTNADAAVEQVRERVPDLFLIDYMMPETDGITTLQRCRALPGAKNVRAVMLTADSRLATLERALARGFDEFLSKPIMDADEFLLRLKDVMSRIC